MPPSPATSSNLEGSGGEGGHTSSAASAPWLRLCTQRTVAVGVGWWLQKSMPGTNMWVLPVDETIPSVFFRLTYP